MPRIISPELNKKLRREYRLRFLSILFFVCSFAIITSILLLSSSYLLLSLYEKAYSSESATREGEAVTKLNENFNKKVNQVHALVQKLPIKNQVADIEIANLLFAYANEGVKLETIEISPDAGKTLVTIRGNALTRDTLLQFRDRINNDSKFKDFVIPIESLTRQKDVSFNVNFTYHEN